MSKINIGLLVNDLDKNKNIIEKVYKDIQEMKDKVLDFSIFFNSVGKIDNNIKCGFFNSSNLTDFSGHLLCYNLDAAIMAQMVVNNIKLYVLCDKLNVLDYFNLKNTNDKIKYIVMDNEQHKNFIRVTGTSACIYNNNIIDIIRNTNNE